MWLSGFVGTSGQSNKMKVLKARLQEGRRICTRPQKSNVFRGCGAASTSATICKCGHATALPEPMDYISVLRTCNPPKRCAYVMSPDLWDTIETAVFSTPMDQNGTRVFTIADELALQQLYHLDEAQTEFLSDLISAACSSFSRGIADGIEYKQNIRKGKHG